MPTLNQNGFQKAFTSKIFCPVLTKSGQANCFSIAKCTTCLTTMWFDAMQRIGYSYVLRRFDNQLAGA
jgi:hypothetical protein